MKQVLFAIAALCAAGSVHAQTSTAVPAPSAVPTSPRTDSNQAVAPPEQMATQPAKGANSFTMDQARGRLEAKGFTNVTALEKDSDGIWRGQADRNGTSTAVWVDYKGNVGPV